MRYCIPQAICHPKVALLISSGLSGMFDEEEMWAGLEKLFPSIYRYGGLVRGGGACLGEGLV